MISLLSCSLLKLSIGRCFAVALAMCLTLGLAQTSAAGTIILASTTGAAGSWTAITSGAPTSFGGYDILAVVTATQSPTQSQLLSTTISLTNNTGATPLYLAFGANGYTQPAAPVIDNTSVTNHQISGVSSATITSWVNVTLANNTNNGWEAGNPAGPITSTNAQANAPLFNISTLAASYAIDQLVVANVALGGQSSISGSTTLTHNSGGPGGAPEPASMVLLGIGVAGMAGYGWRRRKQAVVA